MTADQAEALVEKKMRKLGQLWESFLELTLTHF
jgi:hypothetical protein